MLYSQRMALLQSIISHIFEPNHDVKYNFMIKVYQTMCKMIFILFNDEIRHVFIIYVLFAKKHFHCSSAY